jgi:hypothetical protein
MFMSMRRCVVELLTATDRRATHQVVCQYENDVRPTIDGSCAGCRQQKQENQHAVLPLSHRFALACNVTSGIL